LKALAVLATKPGRQEQVWRAAQRLIVSGERVDSLAVAGVAFTLSQAGFAPNLPWSSMAFSPDADMRQVAAALIPFLNDVDYDVVRSLATDSVVGVRSELAISLKKLVGRGDIQPFEVEAVGALIATLQGDASHAVRSELPAH
jgi:hypothetical protein